SRRWWLFYAGYDGSENGRRATILAAVSDSGASWDRIGPVLEPSGDEVALLEPWVVVAQRRFLMFFVSDDGRRPAIQMATSEDGVSWDRRGNTLPGSGDDVDTLEERSPCLLRMSDGTPRLWFASRPTGGVPAAAPASRVGLAGQLTGVAKGPGREKLPSIAVAFAVDRHLVRLGAGPPRPADGGHRLVAVEDAVVQRCFGRIGPGVTEEGPAARPPSQFRLEAPRAAGEGVAGVVNHRGATSVRDQCRPRASPP